MLAAISPDKDGALGTLRLILQMKAAGHDYSKSLETYLVKVIEQSFQLIDKPEEYSGDALSEALSLALHIKMDSDLKQSLESVIRDKDEEAVSASTALKSLENRF